MTNDNTDTRSPVNLARKVISMAVTELMSSSIHPTQIIEAMTLEIEALRQLMRNVDS
jgi:hypothetical protein